MDKMDTNVKQKLVISAVNLVEGGPLTVLRDCVAAAKELLGNDWDVIVLVNNESLIETSGFALLEFPLAKRSWLIRLYYEWWHFRKLSKIIKPDIWLSLHDITAWVEAPCQAVYCHNPAPFYKITLREAWLEPKLLMFNLFYRYLYGIGIRRNTYVIVQQEWLRQEFKRLYGVRNVIVAHPVVSANQNKMHVEKKIGDNFIFFYPALPRVFKNIDLVCEAVKHLNQAGISGFEVRLTLDGSENRYAAYLIERYANTDGIAFIGRQNQRQMMSQYTESDCVLFPSRLETWGLPISEAKALGKPMLIAELPYAHETVGTYEKVSFIDPFDATGLANKMKSIMDGKFKFSGAVAAPPESPFVSDWGELLMLLTARQ
jgi:glycosyltransferase involved in cell wall biosynthesis